MRFDRVLERLADLPIPLPATPDGLDPRILGSVADPLATLESQWPSGTRDAAALVLLYPDLHHETHVVLIERPAGPHVHAGQVALPGGRRDARDDFPEGTALREAAEEVGLDRVADQVTILGLLDAVDVRVSGHLMVPVLATAPRAPTLEPHECEVARLLRVHVRHFLPDAPIEQVEEVRDGWRLRYGAYRVDGLRVWGATARVLGQLGAVLGRDR